MAGRRTLLSCGFSPTHDPPQAGTKREAIRLGGSIAPVKEHDPIGNKRKHGAARMEDTEGPKRLGSGAWGRRQGLAGLRDDAPSEARGADGERAGRRPQAPTRKQAREHKLRRRRAGAPNGRRAGSPQRGLRDDTPSEARSAGFETTRRAKLAARTPSGRAERAAHGTDAERAARSAADGKRAARGTGFETTRRAKLAARTASGSSRRGRRTGSSQRGLRDDTPSEAHGADAERAGRRPQAPTRRTRAYNEAGTRRAKQRRGPRPRETVRPGGPP